MAYVLNKTRVDDEADLDILRRRDLGQTTAEIAASAGVKRAAIKNKIARIREDDIAHDPEATAYWRTKGTPT
jgi:DNA-binding CsgD family transcriptional regulator